MRKASSAQFDDKERHKIAEKKAIPDQLFHILAMEERYQSINSVGAFSLPQLFHPHIPPPPQFCDFQY